MRGDLDRAAGLAARAHETVKARGAPPFRVLGVASLLAELRAARGDPQGGWDELSATRRAYPLVPAMRAPRLAADLTAARIAAMRGAWDDVDASLAEWRKAPAQGVELPLHARGESLVLAGEAALRRGRSDARALLDEGAATLARIDPPGSPWHARARSDLAERSPSRQ